MSNTDETTPRWDQGTPGRALPGSDPQVPGSAAPPFGAPPGAVGPVPAQEGAPGPGVTPAGSGTGLPQQPAVQASSAGPAPAGGLPSSYRPVGEPWEQASTSHRPPSSPYTSVPSAPAGYSFERGQDRGLNEPAAVGQDGQPPYAPTLTAAPGAAVSHKRARRGPGWVGTVVVALVAALLASGGTVVGLRYLQKDNPAPAAAVSGTTGGVTQTVAPAADGSPDWKAVSSAVSGSVVSITVETASGRTAYGSGVIYDASGHVITNDHVVSGARKIQVTLADGRIYPASLTGTDKATDLAVVQIEQAPKDLTVARMGDSSKLATGQGVMAIGNPLGLSSTVTTGIVSALDRPVVTRQENNEEGDGSQQPGLGQDQGGSPVYTNAIQIDAAINPGNSGGPLFDSSGQVVGITSSIASTGAEKSGSIGIGFAIPGNLVTKVVDQLIANGSATHAYLGVGIKDGNAQADGVTRAGALVGTVEPGSPAANAGVTKNDVITAIDGKPTNQSAALTGFVRQYSAGDTVKLTLVRDGKVQEVSVTLAERKDT